MNKSQLIYHYIRAHKSVSKQNIVLGLKYSLPTITQKLQYLERLKLIDTSQKIANTGGRNATAYSFVKQAKAAIGLYLTGYHISCVAVDLSGEVIKSVRVRVKFNLEDEGYLKKIGEIVEQVKNDAGIADEMLLGVGIAVPSLVSEDGQRVIYGLTFNFTGKTRQEIAKYIPYENKLFHDSDAACYAEVWDDHEICNAFYIGLNNSVGGAVVIDNSIYVGNTHKSGEIGHMTVVPEGGEVCYCGRSGCFNTVCRSTYLDQYTDGNLDDYFELLKSGEPEAVKRWDRYLDYLAIGINNIRMLFDSDIIIGGYVGAYMGDYMDDLCARVDERSTFNDSAKDYLLPCKYKAESAAAGSALSLIDEFLDTI